MLSTAPGRAGIPAEDMEKNFSDWECVFAAVEKGKIAGYCAVLKETVSMMYLIRHISAMYL